MRIASQARVVHDGATMTAQLAAAAMTDRGRVRTSNEDAFLLADLTTGERWAGASATMDRPVGRRGLLVAVSDGMGGAAAGEIASAMSLDALFEGVQRISVMPESDDSEARLRHVVEWANEQVHEAARRPGRQGMGATLTAVLVAGGRAYLAQVGDSRAYFARGGKISQITHDQSYVQLLVDMGAMTPEQAERSPAKNVILQVMGQGPELRVDVGSLEVRVGDRLILCSDGLSNMVSADELGALATAGAPAGETCRALVTRANEAGGQDNVTVVVVDVRAADLSLEQSP